MFRLLRRSLAGSFQWHHKTRANPLPLPLVNLPRNSGNTRNALGHAERVRFSTPLLRMRMPIRIFDNLASCWLLVDFGTCVGLVRAGSGDAPIYVNEINT